MIDDNEAYSQGLVQVMTPILCANRTGRKAHAKHVAMRCPHLAADQVWIDPADSAAVQGNHRQRQGIGRQALDRVEHEDIAGDQSIDQRHRLRDVDLGRTGRIAGAGGKPGTRQF